MNDWFNCLFFVVSPTLNLPNRTRMDPKEKEVFAKEAENFAKFLTRASGSPFVAASVVREMLLVAGFE